MRLENTHRVILDDTLLASPSINEYINHRKVKNLRCFVATQPSGAQEYVLLDTETFEVVYASQSLEALGIRVDLIAFTEKSS